MKKCADQPCPTCPWRLSSTAGGEDIPGFSLELMRSLVSTVPPRGSKADGLYRVMACHHSKPGEEFACAGYIERHGMQNINVRLMMFKGEINTSKVSERTQGIELYPDFYSMLDAYEAVHAQSEQTAD